jgi:phosphatidylinositol alpha-1,6-mannosyltransferase
MNVLFFTTDYKPLPGGIAEHTHRLAEYFDCSDHGVAVLTTRMDGDESFDADQPFPIHRVPGGTVVSAALFAVVLPWLLYRHDIDWIYCSMWFPVGVIAVPVGRLLSVDVAIAVHAHEVVYSDESLRKRFASRLRAVQASVMRLATTVIAVSSYTKDRIVDIGVPESQVTVIYNGVDPAEFDVDDRHDVVEEVDGSRILLTVARLDPRKGQDTVIEALPAVLEDVPDLTYLVAGGGDQRRLDNLRALAEDRGVQDRIRFLGHVPDEELPALYNAADVFTMPNRREGTSVEGFGIVFLEANAAGVPVVGGDHGGATDAVADGESGILVDPDDVDEVADAIVRLLSDEELRSSLGDRGRERVADGFTWTDVGQRLERALR